MYALAVWLLLAVAGGVTGHQAQPKSPAIAQSDEKASTRTIAVKQSPPQRLAVRDHDGPYWRIGPLLGEVHKYMQDHRGAGPIVVRYAATSAGSISRPSHAAVGFLIDEEQRPESPFRSMSKEAELVACTVFEDRPGPTQRDYAGIREWALARGYEPTGQITELYDLAPPGKPAGSMRIEIQVAVVTRVPPPPQVMAAGRTTRRVASEQQQPESTPAPAAPQAPAVQSPLETRPREGPVPANPTGDALKRVAAPVETQTELPPEPPPQIRELVATAQYDKVAVQVMPDNRVIAPLDRLWLGQLVFRIGALARGVEQVYPGQAGRIAALADALRSRYKSLFAEGEKSPMGEVVVRLDPRDAPLAARKRAMMADLDRLLARVALQTVSADASLEEMIRLLERLKELFE